MAKATRVQVIKETSEKLKSGDWFLCLQWCLYVHSEGTSEHGYRFIYRHNNKLRAMRGQSRIPSVAMMQRLIQTTQTEGWGSFDTEKSL